MINKLYHPKQQEVLKFALNNDYFMLINHGAKRTGKTILNNDLFLFELKRVRRIANRLNIKKPQYILAGADLGALQRNVLNELTNKYDIEFNFDKHNRFMLFGVQVCCFGHSKINDLGRIRGMTAFGAYINEATISNREVFNEIKSRCSGEGARLLIDTNPDNPEHWLKVDFIDKADGKTVQEYRYELDDNTFLTDRYRENIKNSTPSGMFYDRDILGLWVTAEGAVYKDFNRDIHYVKSIEGVNFVKFIAGMDWGYEHFGALIVIGIDDKGDHYLVKEVSKQHEEVDFWIEEAKKVKAEYGNIPIYCDTARPEYIKKFKNNNLNAKNADKSVLSGIESVASLFKMNRLLILEPAVTRFKQEIYMYVWNPKTGEPIKLYDDVLDAIRYAIYSEGVKSKVKVKSKAKIGLR